MLMDDIAQVAQVTQKKMPLKYKNKIKRKCFCTFFSFARMTEVMQHNDYPDRQLSLADNDT
jgi:hypothetical protein